MTNTHSKHNKKIGRDLIKKASEMAEVTFTPTGIPPLDFAMGGGLPQGRMISIKGQPSATKTSLALTMIASAQKQGINCVFVDAEWALLPKYAESLGVDLDKLLVIAPNTAEEAIDAVEVLIRDEARPSLVVVDSVSALSAKAESEADIEKQGMALQARVITRALRKLTPITSSTNSTIVWINQLRQNLLGGQYNPYIETGGMALKFFTSVALEVKRKTGIEKDGKIAGYGIEIKVTKNKLGPPARSCELKFFFDSGFYCPRTVWVDIGQELGLITRSGNSYSFKEEKLGIGKDASTELLTDKMIDEIKSLI